MGSLQPAVLGLDVEKRIRLLASVGFTRSQVLKLTGSSPVLLMLDAEKRVTQLVAVGNVLQLTGLTRACVLNWTAQRPQVLGYSVRNRLGPRVAALKAKGIGLSLKDLYVDKTTEYFIYRHGLKAEDWGTSLELFQDLWDKSTAQSQ